MSKTWIAKLSLLLLAALTAVSAQTLGGKAKPGREIEVRFLYPAGMYYEYGVLFPLVLEYQNKSTFPQSFELDWESTVPVPSEYRKMVLEPGAKKRIPMIMPPNAVGNMYDVSINGYTLQLGVTSNNQTKVTGLLSSKEESLGYIRSLQVVKNPYYNPGNSADDEEYNSPQSISTLDPQIFPEHWAPLASLQVIVAHDLSSTSLNENQYNALVNWVRQGGQLVLVTNGLPTEYKGTALEEILPFQPKGVVTEEKSLRIEGSLLEGASVLEGEKEKPLVIGKRQLKGMVYYVTVPLLDTELMGKAQTEAVWRKVFDSNTPQVGRLHSYDLLDYIPELPRTEPGWVALFVILYGIIVGPVNLSILRKRDKMLWAFITVPLVAMMFAGGAYLVNRLLRPSDIVVRELGYLSLEEGEQLGYSESEHVLFSPGSGDITVRSNAATSFSISGNRYGRDYRQFGLYNITPEAGLESKLEMSTWDAQRFEAQSVISLESPVRIKMISDNEIEIDSPFGSPENSAVVVLPKRKSSTGFTLKKGKNRYTLDFQGNNADQELEWDDKTLPGRRDLFRKLQAVTVNYGVLHVFTDQIQTPLDVGEGTAYKHDFLVNVEWKL